MLQCYFCNLKKIFLRMSPLLQSVAAVCAHQCSLFLDLRVANSYFFISIRMLAISAIFHGNCPTSTPGFAATENFCVSPLLRYPIRIFYSGRTMISPGSVCLL